MHRSSTQSWCEYFARSCHRTQECRQTIRVVGHVDEHRWMRCRGASRGVSYDPLLTRPKSSQPPHRRQRLDGRRLSPHDVFHDAHRHRHILRLMRPTQIKCDGGIGVRRRSHRQSCGGASLWVDPGRFRVLGDRKQRRAHVVGAPS